RGLVYEAQQALAAEGGYWELADAGVFYAFAMVRPDGDIARVERLFFREIERLRDEPVPAAELDKAKRQIEVDLLRGTDTAHALGSRIARDWVTFGRIRPIEERLAAYRAVGADDVQRVARTYLRPETRNVLHLVAPPPGVVLEEPAPPPARTSSRARTCAPQRATGCISWVRRPVSCSRSWRPRRPPRPRRARTPRARRKAAVDAPTARRALRRAARRRNGGLRVRAEAGLGAAASAGGRGARAARRPPAPRDAPQRPRAAGARGPRAAAARDRAPAAARRRDRDPGRRRRGVAHGRRDGARRRRARRAGARARGRGDR